MASIIITPVSVSIELGANYLDLDILVRYCLQNNLNIVPVSFTSEGTYILCLSTRSGKILSILDHEECVKFLNGRK